jgi:hypothetical protein
MLTGALASFGRVGIPTPMVYAPTYLWRRRHSEHLDVLYAHYASGRWMFDRCPRDRRHFPRTPQRHHANLTLRRRIDIWHEPIANMLGNFSGLCAPRPDFFVLRSPLLRFRAERGTCRKPEYQRVFSPSERSAARLAHQSGGLGVASSNLAAPTR